jgi:hypothetical protein
MRQLVTVVLFCVLLASSGFATSHNRFDTRTILTPRTPSHLPQGPKASSVGIPQGKLQSGKRLRSTNAHLKKTHN